jgi:hypothetical protein
MSMAIVTLLRVTPGCVAVDTARVGHYAIDLLPGCKAFGAELARFPLRLTAARSPEKGNCDESDCEKTYF